MKRCSRCRKRKPLAAFAKDAGTTLGVRHECRACKKTADAAYRRNNAEAIKTRVKGRRPKQRVGERRRMYGLTDEAYTALSAAQGDACAICKSDVELLHVDHDHVTGKVRGLLCRDCNSALGRFKDDPARLSAAIAYLASPPAGDHAAAFHSSTRSRADSASQ